MMKLKKSTWSEITLADYDRIMEIGYDTELSDAEKDVALISLLTEVPEDEIWELPLDEIKMLKIELLFLTDDFDYPKTINFKKIRIGEWECEVLQDLGKMTYAQFVDYQNYLNVLDETGMSPKNKAGILSVFFIPKGHKYNDGYDLLAFQKAIRENVSIKDYNSVWFFFLHKSESSLKSTATSLASRLTAMSLLMRKKNPLRAKVKELAKLTKGLAHSIG